MMGRLARILARASSIDRECRFIRNAVATLILHKGHANHQIIPVAL